MKKQRYFIILILSIGLLGMLAALSPQKSVAGQAQDPETAVEQAWQLAQESGQYNFDTVIDQTTYPVLRLDNAGASPIEDTMAMEGQVDLSNQVMELTFWQNGSFDPNKGVSIRVEDGRSFGRSPQGEWQEIENIGDLFAPGGDPMAFLAGIENVSTGQTNQIDIGGEETGLSLLLTRYNFEMNEPLFADLLRQQLETRLREQGDLPQGLSLSSSEIYRSMTGEGTIWIDENGLPARMVINLDFPAREDTGRITAVITNDFSRYDLAAIGLAQTTFSQNPLLWLANRLPNQQVGQQIGLNFSLLLIFVAFIGLSIPHWRSRRFYSAVALSIIFSMLITPFLQGHHYRVFQNRQAAQQKSHQAQQAEAEQQTQLEQQAQETDWNPNMVPTEQFILQQKDKVINKPNIQGQVPVTDTDGDGLSDADEDEWLTCAYAGAPINCDGVADPTDSDGDGLSDGLEVNGLGIIPTKVDSDNDTIHDNLEVAGFSYNGQMWYLDPMENDTNRDGNPDSLDCPVWTEGMPDYDPTAVCPDTDNDGIPNPFDPDNDGDGVDDKYDFSPDSASSATFDNDNPFSFSIENLRVDRPILVDFQIRPLDPSHLSYQTRVLDWPSGDSAGQIQRVNDTTFATTDNLNIRSNDFNANYGDIRLVPMLEITMPFEAGHYANLPVLDGQPSSRGGGSRPVEDWLDTTELDPYGITVRDIDESATDLVAYAPVSLVSGSQGEGLQAFTARMIYYPEQANGLFANWGANEHQVRLVWLVQMITDACTDPDEDPETCVDRTDTLSVVQVYEEEWQLTGMRVSEERGLDVALMYEDPAADNDRQLDDQLWMVAWNLNNTFLSGRDCVLVNGSSCSSDGNRDVPITNIEASIDSWSNNSSHVAVQNYSYLHEGYGALFGLQEIPAVLDTVFSPYAGDTTPTILVAQEKRHRLQNLDTLGVPVNDSVTVSFEQDLTPDSVMVGMSWSPYKYVNGQWTNFDLEEYLTLLEHRLSQEAVLFPLDTPEGEQEALLNWAQTFYATLYFGLSTMVEADDTLVWFEREEELISDPAWVFVGLQFPVIASNYIDKMLAAFKTISKTVTAAGKWEKFFKYSGSNLGALDDRLVNGMVTHDFLVDTSFFLAITGAILLSLGYISGNDTLVKTGTVLIMASSVVMALAHISLLISQVMAATQAGLTIVQSMKAVAAAQSTMSTFGKWLKIGLAVVGLTLIWGAFGYGVITNGLSASDVGFHLLLAATVANTIVFLFFLVLTFIPVVGQFIVAIISLIDAILFIFGKKGVSTYATEWLADLFYDVDFVITNMKSPDRLDLAVEEMTFQEPEMGFTVGNVVNFTFGVTNTIKFHKSSPSHHASRSTFSYTVQSEAIDQHELLQKGTMNDEWVRLDGRFFQFNQTVPFTQPIALNQVQSGINRSLDGLVYLTESYVQPYEGCWLFTESVNGACEISYFKGSSHLNLGASLIYDILPNTIGTFVDMKWNNSDNILFPVQKDFDGDGLLSQAQGGTDPDDREFDTDGDGLGDRFELTIGLDPTDPDSDEDGLTDKEELAYRTDPLNHDYDGDGLTDYVEVKVGWLAQYGVDSNGQALVTRVWSNPLVADADQDSLSDLQEFVFGGNPWVPTDPSIIERTITFDNFDVTESNAPAILTRFEESADSFTFADSSGHGFTGVCDSNGGCPVAGVNGIYGSAVLFDGQSGTYIESAETALLDSFSGDFSVGGWVNTTQGGALFSIADDVTPFNEGEVQFIVGDSQTFGDSSHFISASGAAIDDGQWHHVMVVWDFDEVSGQSGTGAIYRDGVNVTTIDSYSGAVPINSNNSFRIGANTFGTSFDGAIDEIVAFDRALTPEEVVGVMNGRYNPNDGIAPPGTELNYQVTVTNTSPSQAADGYLQAQAQYVEPALPAPDLALSFEQDQIIPDYTPSSGKTPTCPANGGLCPKFLPGIRGAAAYFDGINDRLILPHLGQDQFNFSQSLSFWLNVSSLPTGPDPAYILYSRDGWHEEGVPENGGGISIYLESDGTMVFFVGGRRDPVDFTCYTSDCTSNSNPGNNFRHKTNFYTNSANLNGWHHFVFEYRKGGDRAILMINGTKESQMTYDQCCESTYPYIGHDTVGKGYLGHINMNGTDYNGVNFHGAIDEFAVYQFESGPLMTDDSAFVSSVRNGLYDYNGNFPTVLVNFDSLEPTVVINQANDLPGALCPTATACPTVDPNGKYGSAVSFDGIDDHLNLGEMDFATGDYTVAAWVRTTGNSQQTVIRGLDIDNHVNPGFLLEITGSGGVRYVHRFPAAGVGGGTVGGSPPGQSMNDGQWHHVAAVRQDDNMLLYLDGQLVGTAVISGSSEEPVIVNIGRFHRSNPRLFSGQLDELVVIPAAVTGEEVQFLMNSSWPIIEIPADGVTFNAPAQTAVTASGQAQVSEFAQSGWQQITKQVETVLQLPANVNVPIVDDNASALDAYLPFDLETPGDVLFDDITDQSDFVCLNNDPARCPTIVFDGLRGQSVYFDGVDDALQATDETDMGESFSFWIKALDVSNGGNLIDTSDLFQEPTTSVNVGHRLNVSFGQGNGATDLLFVDIPAYEWVHIVLVGRDDPLVYINGQAQGRLDSWGWIEQPHPYDGPITLGNRHNGNAPFHGFMDDFRSYDIDLTEADVLQLYQDSTPRLAFDFDEGGEATYFVDSSPNQFIGYPTSSKNCAELILNQVTVNALSVEPSHLRISLDGETLWENENVSVGDVIDLASQGVLCGGQQIEMTNLTANATTSRATNANNTGNFNLNFSVGSEAVRIDWDVHDAYTVINPAPGTDGKMGNTVLFDGSGILVDPADDSNLDLDELTILAWVSPEEIREGVWQVILNKSGNDNNGNIARNYSLSIPPGGLLPQFTTQGSDCSTFVTVNGNSSLVANQWNHVAVTFTPDQAKIFINGVLDRTSNFSTPVDMCQNDYPIRIGNNLVGELDEVALYGRAMSESEIFHTYLLQTRTYGDSSSYQLQIDNDSPTIELLSSYPYRANGYIQLAVGTVDASSRVPMLTMGLKAPGDSSFTWQGVQACDEESLNSAVWCPDFDSTTLAGEGMYEIQFRAIDAVGNETLSAIHTLYVDNSPPTASSSHNGEWLPIVEDANDDRVWSVSLSGTLDDPAVGGVAGSGVVTETAVIRLIGPTGNLLGGAPQNLIINGNSWSVDYTVVGARPSSLYTIEVTVEDQVGNEAIVEVGTVRLDKRPTSVDLDPQMIAGSIITQAMPLSGIVGEIPDWGGELAHYHFEGMGEAIALGDSSGQGNHGTCTNCPIIGVPGISGSAIQFDGVDDTVNLTPMFDPVTDTFSLSLWFLDNGANSATAQVLVMQTTGTGTTGRALLFLRPNNQLTTALGGTWVSASTNVSENVWHHAALTYDGGTVRFYLDGQLDGESDVTAEPADGMLQLGSNRGNQAFFAGVMDEVMVYNRALTEQEILALAQTDSVGVQGVDVGLELVDSPTISGSVDIEARLDNINWLPANISNPNAPLSQWSYDLPDGLENLYEIYLRSSDASNNQSNARMAWRGMIDSIAPRVMMSATLLGSDATAETEYSFSIEDFVLDETSFVHPCSANDLVSQSYTDGDSPLFGQVYQVSATCRLSGHQTNSVMVSACDMAGLCTDVSAVPASGSEPTPTPPANAPLIGETGSLTLDGTIDQGISASVSLQGSYVDPVVVAFVATFNDPEPVEVRVHNVTPTGFDIFLEEAGGDLSHGSEMVNYIVMESGVHVLEGGLVLEAGKLDTATVHVGGMSPVGDQVSFTNSFSSIPAVLYTLNSYNNGDFMSSTSYNVTVSSFNLGQEAAETGMTAVSETIGWIAFSTGIGTTSGFNYDINQGSLSGRDGVTDNEPHTITYSFSETPVAIVKSNTSAGPDGFWTRGGGIYDASTLVVFAEEDMVTDSEQTHANESFSWAVFDVGTLFYSDGGNTSNAGVPEESSDSSNRFGGAAVGGELPTEFLMVFMGLMLLLIAGAFLINRRKND